ncbi:putative pentatricopeptide repeat-containing protein [Quercus suber]|uniref:Pentatricopeptide repeat-containing protein n=1 Tax=Quercus suber TaxID=58331 RepID=A0AAW0J3Y2_QUESU
MRVQSSLASRASPAIRNLPEEAWNKHKLQRDSPSKVKSKELTNFEAPSRGNPSPLNSQFRNPNLVSISKTPISAHKRKLSIKPIDHQYISQVLSRKDWFLLLNHEVKVGRIVLNPQFVVSLLQNQENPLHPLKFYIWVSNIDPSFAKNHAVRGVLAKTLYRNGPVVLSVELLQDIRNSGFRVSEDLLVILIGSWGRLGLAKYCAEVFGQISFLGLSPTTRLYNAVIDALVKSNSLDLAYLKFQQMTADNCNPDRSLVHGVFRCVAPNKAFELLSRFVKRELVLSKLAYDTILYCLSNKSMAREAAMFLRSCGAKGYLPDSSLFNITMACLIKGLDLNETCEIFRSFIERGVKPGFDTYLALIEATYKAGRSDEGNCFLDQMVKNGLVSNVFCYNMVINCFCKENKMERASETFRDMQHRGIAPNIVTFNTLISGYCRDGDMSKARELMMMLLEHGYKPDIFTFNSIIDGLCRVHQIGDAFACFTEMVEWGVTPNAVTYNILIRSLCIIGDVTRSIKLLRKMQANGIDPDTFTVNALIQSFCRLNKLEKAEKLFNSMMTTGLNPDNYTYSTMIKAFCECGRVDEAKEMFHSMEANGCLPDSYTCNLMLETLVRLAHFEEARNLVKMFSEMGISLKSNPNL